MIKAGDVRPILRKLQRRMRLGYWKINLRWVEDETWENHATIGIVDGRPEAILTLHRYMQPKDLEDVLKHELSHLVLHPLRKILDDYETMLGEVGPLYQRQVLEAEEQVVDHLSHVL